MGQIVGGAAKPKRCNISKLSQLGTPSAGEYILVSSDNSMNAAGQGNFDCYIVGDRTTAATELPLHTIADDSAVKDGKNAVSSGAVYKLINGKDKNYTDGYLFQNQGILPSDDDIVSDFVPCVLGDTIVWYNGYTEAKNVHLVYYDQNKNIVPSAYYNADDATKVPSRTLVVSADAVRYVRATFNKNNPNVYLSVNGVKKWERIDEVIGVVQQIGGIELKLDGRDKNYTDGYLFKDNGILSSEEDIVSDFVPCVLGDTIEWYNGYAEAKSVYLVYYDQNKIIVPSAYYNADDATRVPSRTLVVSADAVRYVRATFNKNNPNVYLSVNGVKEWERIDEVIGCRQEFDKCNAKIDEVKASVGEWSGVSHSPYYQLSVGYVNAVHGNYTETSSTNKKTNNIKVHGYDRIKFLGKRTTQADVVSGAAFYDEGLNFISGVPFYNNKWTDIGAQEYDVEIPASAYYFRTTIGNDIANDAYIELIKDETISQATKGIVQGQQFIFPVIGSPKPYFSEPTSEVAMDISSKTAAQLYAEYDALVTAYPNYVQRDADRGSVVVNDVSYPMAAYTFGFNKNILIDHEPTDDEVISTSSNKWTPNLNPRKILLVSGMHGEEHTPCWGMMLALSEMLSSTEDWALYLKNNFIFKVIPCLNPYGFSFNTRENSQGHYMNRDNAENDPESTMYMEWVSENSDAFILIDVHGTQGRYAYFPVLDGLPISDFCYSLAGKMSALLFPNWKNFYDGISQGYGTTYSPFLVAKTNAYTWTRGRFACRMYEDYGVQMMAIETPDDLVSPDRYHNDLRNCKLTKDMLINVLETFGGLQQLPHED